MDDSFSYFVRNVNDRINMINHRKEFFKVHIDDIEKVIKENHDKTIDLIKISYVMRKNIESLLR